MAPLVVCLHGLLSGWLAVLLVGRSGTVQFTPPDPAATQVFNYCASIGYPKQADWFWYAATVLGGVAGILAGVRLWRSLRRYGPFLPDSPLPVTAGFGALAAAFFLGFSLDHATGAAVAALAGLGALLPWLSRRWYSAGKEPATSGPAGRQPGIPAVKSVALWTGTAAIIALAWIWDPRIFSRNLDGLHEGVHLLQVEAALSGDEPGLTTRSEYGPLYTRSLIWWMRGFGMTVSAERLYFLAAQVAGTAIHLVLLRTVCAYPVALLTGGWLMLTLTTAQVIEYGWANALRTALPLLGIIMYRSGLTAGGRTRLIAAGALSAVSLLYSTEFGAAGLAACALLAVVHRRDPGRTLWWAFGFAAALAVLSAAMFGSRALEFVGGQLGGGYALTRLGGHGTRPLPPFPWWTSFPDLIRLFWRVKWTVRAWGPALVCSTAAGWLLVRRRSVTDPALFVALLAFAVIAQVPVVARPLTQTTTSAPPLVLLAAMMLAGLSATGRVNGARIVAGALLIMGLVLPVGSLGDWLNKYRRAEPEATAPLPRDAADRMGRVTVSGRQSAELASAVGLLARLAGPGDRIYCAAPFHTYLCFLADRPALGPFLLAHLAATPADRALILAALERERPSVALLSPLSIDVPYPEEHALELAWIVKNYRLARKIDNLLIYARRR